MSLQIQPACLQVSMQIEFGAVEKAMMAAKRPTCLVENEGGTVGDSQLRLNVSPHKLPMKWTLIRQIDFSKLYPFFELQKQS